MAQLSARMCSSFTSGAYDLWVAVTTSFHRTPVRMTLRFSAECTLLPRLRARSKATLAMRSISEVV